MNRVGTIRREHTKRSSAVALLVLVLFATRAASLPAQSEQGSTRQLTLQQVLSEVIPSHPLIGAADARVRAARGNRTTAGAPGNPMVAYLVENAALPARSAPPMEREAMAMATIPLQSFYQRWPSVRRANAEVGVADAEAVMARQQVGLATARAFYRTALAQVRLATARDLVAWLDSIVAYNRVRVKEGVAAEADLIRSQLERDRAAAEETMQAAELARARGELGAFITDGAQVRLVFDTVPLGISLAIAPEMVYQRPDLRVARGRADAARAGVSVERSMLVHEITATVGLKRSAGTTSLIAGASLPLPLFNQNRGEIARATAERDVATLELVAVERAAHAELVGAHAAAQLLTERAASLSSGFLARAEEARHITLGAYREGAAPLFQVIDAARAWGEARRSYYETVFAQHESVLELVVARGEPLSAPLGLNR